MKKKSANKKPQAAGSASKKLTPTPASSELPEWFTIANPEQLKLLTNDLRMRILGQFAEGELTAKQVAQRLGESPTKLYRHVDALAEHGLIVPTREEQKRGTVQKFYRAVARRFRVDDTCFGQDVGPTDSRLGAIVQLLNTMGGDLAQLSHNFQDEYVAAFAALSVLPKADMEAIGQQIFDAVTKILNQHEQPKKKRKPTGAEYRVAIVIQPTVNEK